MAVVLLQVGVSFVDTIVEAENLARQQRKNTPLQITADLSLRNLGFHISEIIQNAIPKKLKSKGSENPIIRRGIRTGEGGQEKLEIEAIVFCEK